jgi:hypothetical protein
MVKEGVRIALSKYSDCAMGWRVRVHFLTGTRIFLFLLCPYWGPIWYILQVLSQ